MQKLSPKEIKGRTRQRLSDAKEIMEELSLAMGIRYQSNVDFEYKTFAFTSVSLAQIMKDELSKPEYRKRRYKASALLGSAAAAIAEVYLKRDKPTTQPTA